MLDGAPRGTISLLFADLCGSVRLFESLGHESAVPIMLRHNQLLKDAIKAHSGYIFNTVGDEVCSAFDATTDAVTAAAAARRAVHAEHWSAHHPDCPPLRFRAAIHAGPAVAVDGNYFGNALNRVSRLERAANPDQILLSRVAQLLVRDDIPAGCSLHDCGDFKLENLRYSERIYCLQVVGLPENSAEPRSRRRDIADKAKENGSPRLLEQARSN